jgi:hypothetical protein
MAIARRDSESIAAQGFLRSREEDLDLDLEDREWKEGVLEREPATRSAELLLAATAAAGSSSGSGRTVADLDTTTTLLVSEEMSDLPRD